MSITNSGKIHIVQNQEDSAPHTTHIVVNNHNKYSGPRHKDSIIRHQFECTTQWREDYTHTHTHTHTHTRNKNSQTPKKLRKNTRKPLPCKYYIPTTLDTYKQRHTPQRFTHFYISHTCSLSHRKPNAPSLCTHTHTAKPWRQTKPPPAENKKFWRITRCQTNQSRNPPQHKSI